MLSTALVDVGSSSRHPGRRTAVLCSDFALDRVEPTGWFGEEVSSYYDEHELDSGRRQSRTRKASWPAGRGVLVCDFGALHRRKTVLRESKDEYVEDGSGAEQVSAEDEVGMLLSDMGLNLNVEESGWQTVKLPRDDWEHGNVKIGGTSEDQDDYSNQTSCFDEPSNCTTSTSRTIDSQRQHPHARALEAPPISESMTASERRKASYTEKFRARKRLLQERYPTDDSPAITSPSRNALHRIWLVKSHIIRPTPPPTPRLDCRRNGCLELLSRLTKNHPPEARIRCCVHEGCGFVSRTKEQWWMHVESVHHVEEESRKRMGWDDWGEGGRCCG